jgi:hypothetical protein
LSMQSSTVMRAMAFSSSNQSASQPILIVASLLT